MPIRLDIIEKAATPRQRWLSFMEVCQKLISSKTFEGSEDLKILNKELDEQLLEITSGSGRLELTPKLVITGVRFIESKDQPDQAFLDFQINDHKYRYYDEITIDLLFYQIRSLKQKDLVYDLFCKMTPAASDKFLDWIDLEVTRLTQDRLPNHFLGMARVTDSYYATTVKGEDSQIYAIYEYSNLAANQPNPETVGKYAAERLRAFLDGGSLCSIKVGDGSQICNYVDCNVIPA